jgi:cytochrome c553
MESRLVLFIVFLTLIAGVLSLSGYKKYFNESRVLNEKSLAASSSATSQTTEVAEVEEVDDTPKEVVLDTPQLERGHAVYTQKGECITCHGQYGEGNPKEEAPLIAGQHDWYIIDQLKQMKAGKRVNEKMNPYLKKINAQDIEDVAAYMTKLRTNKRAE